MINPWPICELHGQAEGACLPCFREDLIRDRCPDWTWRLLNSALFSISMGHADLAYAQVRQVAHVVRFHSKDFK
jgi:hypothetical protein